MTAESLNRNAMLSAVIDRRYRESIDKNFSLR